MLMTLTNGQLSDIKLAHLVIAEMPLAERAWELLTAKKCD